MFRGMNIAFSKFAPVKTAPLNVESQKQVPLKFPFMDSEYEKSIEFAKTEFSNTVSFANMEFLKFASLKVHSAKLVGALKYTLEKSTEYGKLAPRKL